jgi:hypothetical protein
VRPLYLVGLNVPLQEKLCVCIIILYMTLSASPHDKLRLCNVLGIVTTPALLLIKWLQYVLE